MLTLEQLILTDLDAFSAVSDEALRALASALSRVPVAALKVLAEAHCRVGAIRAEFRALGL